ncbi:MAG: hypothetical protein P8181_14090 [bacterium]
MDLTVVVDCGQFESVDVQIAYAWIYALEHEVLNALIAFIA